MNGTAKIVSEYGGYYRESLYKVQAYTWVLGDYAWKTIGYFETLQEAEYVARKRAREAVEDTRVIEPQLRPKDQARCKCECGE